MGHCIFQVKKPSFKRHIFANIGTYKNENQRCISLLILFNYTFFNFYITQQLQDSKQENVMCQVMLYIGSIFYIKRIPLLLNLIQ